MNKIKHISLLLICAFFLSSCATVPVTNRRQLSLISQKSLLSLSQKSYNQLLEKSELSENQSQIDLVKNVGQKIAAAAEQFMRDEGMARQIKNYAWEFNLFEDEKVINAFCMHGGKIGVYSGILPVTENETGLAVVMAHEVAHTIANHNGERLSQLILVQMGGSSLSTAMNDKSDATKDMWMKLFGVGSSVGVILPFSRIQESEADYIGLIIMTLAGYDPGEAIPFWERMNKQEQARPPEFLSTHPVPRRRIEDIRKALPEIREKYDHN